MRVIQSINTPRGPLTVIHDATPEELAAHDISPRLSSIVRNADIRRSVLHNLAADAEARLTFAAAGGVIVGRASIGPSFGRWRALPRVREFAIEVARGWRLIALARRR